MGLSTITINRGQGGLNQPLPGKDHISGILLMEESLGLLDGATGLLSSTNVQALVIYNLEDAEALGITAGSANGGVLWKHIRDFFLMAPGAELWVGECTTTNAKTVTTTDWEDILTAAVEEFQNLAGGSLRQLGIVHHTGASMTTVIEAATLAALQLKLTAIQNNDKPLISVIGTIYSAGTAVSGAPDLTASDYERIVAVSGSTTETKPSATGTVNFAGPIGLILGLIAAASVHESIAWPAAFDGITGAGYLTPSHSSSEVGALIDKGYLDLVQYTDLGGLYVAKSNTAAASDSDYNRIEKVRTMDKAVRNVRAKLLPQLNSPLYVNTDGTLRPSTVAYFQNLGSQALEAMNTDGEISAFAVSIDPTQNVLSTNKLIITLKIIPVGSSEEIVANIGYTLNIA